MELQWPLILFTTFIAWSAGLFGTQALYLIRGEGKKSQMTALIVSLVLLAIGGVAVFMHLQHWERIFNGFGHLTSGITQELIAIVVMIILMVAYFVCLRRSGSETAVPKWLLWLSVIVAIAMTAVCAHSYMMASRPVWNSIFQLLSVMGAACAFGPATMAAICAVKKESGEYCGKTSLVGSIVNATTTICYIVAAAMATSSFTSVPYWFDPTNPTQSMTDVSTLSPFSGDALGVTCGAIAFALAAVFVAYLGKKKDSWKINGSAIAICVLISAICLRATFYVLGISVYPLFD